MNDRKGERTKGDKKGIKYEKAMQEAFSEIFRNLREIERDTKMQRLKVDLEKMTGSAPAASLRDYAIKRTHKKIGPIITTW